MQHCRTSMHRCCISVKGSLCSCLTQSQFQQIKWLVYACLQVPLPINYLFTQDYVEECLQNQVVPSGSDVKGFKELDVQPKSILSGEPIEHIRHFRVGGYELGTTSGGAAAAGGHGMKDYDGGRATT